MFKKIVSTMVVVAMVFTMTGGYEIAFAKPLQQGDTGNRLSYEKKDTPEYVKGEVLVLFKENGNLKSFSKNRAKQIAKLSEDVIVKETWQFKDTKKSKKNRITLRKNENKRIKANAIGGNLNIALVKSKTLSTEKLINQLKKNPAIEKVEPNRIVRISTVNDEYYGFQWGLKNKGQNGGKEGIATNPQSCWNITNKGETVVAVVDSGVDYTHPDLKNCMWENTNYPKLKGRYGFDFANHDDDPMDDNNHGTHCAGIIAAEKNNNTGICGINPYAKIMALKFIDENGSGSAAGALGAYSYIDRALDLGINVSAINNSWGGGGYDDILDKIVTRLGEKGVVSCFASGNEGENIDDNPGYLNVAYDNPYVITVNATNEKNQLASFSNYGKNTTHIGAPGTDILSSVAASVYNPTIYSMSKREKINSNYNGFENNTSKFGIPDNETFVSSFKKNSDATYKAKIVDEEYFGKKSGKSLKLTFDNLQQDEMIKVTLPYKRPALTFEEGKPYISAMVRGEREHKGLGPSFFYIVETAKGEGPTSVDDCDKILENNGGGNTYFDENNNSWSHISFQSSSNSKETKGTMLEREITFCLLAQSAGTHTIYLDDFAISKTNIDELELGKYDFYSGTSMATPFVAGAVALLADKKNKKSNGFTKINDLLEHVNKDNNLTESCIYGANIDLSKKTNNDSTIAITSIKTDYLNKTIIINGYNLASPNLTVSFNGKDVKVIKRSENQLIVNGNNWLNNIVDIELSLGDKKSIKKNVYLVQSKKNYDKLAKVSFPSDARSFASDGHNIYSIDSNRTVISKLNIKTGENENLTDVTMENLFKKETKKTITNENIKTKFSNQLAYGDGNLYTIVSRYVSSDIENETDALADYSSQNKLISINAVNGKVRDLGALPKFVDRLEDYTMASYNGKLYIVGGYDFEKYQVSRKVYIYNPKSKKWMEGPALPEGRGGGVLRQIGNQLIYTLGYSPSTKITNEGGTTQCPSNLALVGKNWSVVKGPAITSPSCIINKTGELFYQYYGSVGIWKNGLVYAGLPTKNLGDTYTFDASIGQYKELMYQFNKTDDEEFFFGISAGKYMYGTDSNENSLRFKINNGNVAVKTKKYKGGKIVGGNKYVAPGNQVIVKVIPNKGYKLKSFTLNGVKQNVKMMVTSGKVVRLTDNQKAVAIFTKDK